MMKLNKAEKFVKWLKSEGKSRIQIAYMLEKKFDLRQVYADVPKTTHLPVEYINALNKYF